MNAPAASYSESLVARTMLYRFLALAMHEPGEALAASLGSPEQMSDLAAAADHLDQVAGVTVLGPAVRALLESVPPGGWPLRALRVEYTRLFIGPGQMPCPPYESVYDQTRPHGEQGTVEGPSARVMANALAAEGLVIDLGRAELADHVAIELEWMYYLLNRGVMSEPGTAAGYVERANDFLKQHLAAWLPDFAQRVVESARHPFYARLGELLISGMRVEAEVLANAGVPA